MSKEPEYSTTVVIENPLGFHVRPVQRFAELAKVFEGDVEVQIGDRKASGKSVMGLMGLGGTRGSEMKITTRGEDARQAVELLGYLVSENFFVEDDIREGERPERHIERLNKFSSIFESNIRVQIDDHEVDASNGESLRELCLQPTSEVTFDVSGEDERQAREILEKLAHYCFYVEEAMGAKSEKKG